MSYLAKSYMAAAELLQAAPQHWLPMLQLTGQAVELALKAYLAASKVAPPNGHDLLDLYRRAQAHGVTLEGPMFAALVHLQHFYFEDLVTRTRYKSRYPARKLERVGGAVPPYSMFASIVSSLTEQARERGRNVA